jgi:hypothetical protein
MNVCLILVLSLTIYGAFIDMNCDLFVYACKIYS